MTKKDELLKECVEIMKRPAVEAWYDKNLKTKLQVETINILDEAVYLDKLTPREALCIALIVGVQWNDKFKGVP